MDCPGYSPILSVFGGLGKVEGVYHDVAGRSDGGTGSGGDESESRLHLERGRKGRERESGKGRRVVMGVETSKEVVESCKKRG